MRGDIGWEMGNHSFGIFHFRELTGKIFAYIINQLCIEPVFETRYGILAELG